MLNVKGMRLPVDMILVCLLVCSILVKLQELGRNEGGGGGARRIGGSFYSKRWVIRFLPLLEKAFRR